MNPILQYWYFHLPNFVLAALMYSLLGRIVLSFFVPLEWQNYIWRAFVRLTDPVLRVVGWLTPAGVPPVVLMIFAFFWLMVARVIFFMAIGQAGLLPPVGAS